MCGGDRCGGARYSGARWLGKTAVSRQFLEISIRAVLLGVTPRVDHTYQSNDMMCRRREEDCEK